MLHPILDCAHWALSVGNGQPWEFIVVRDQATHYKIVDYYLKQMEPKRQMDLAVRGTAKMTGSGCRHEPSISLLSVIPGLSRHTRFAGIWKKSESHFITGLANATLMIHLAATSRGLASRYASDANSPDMETMLKVLLKVPEPLRVYHPEPIGYVRGNFVAPPRRTLEDVIHYETYVGSKYRNEQAIERFVRTLTLQGAYGKRTAEDDR